MRPLILTTYRLMAEDVIDLAIEKSGLKAGPCVTKELMVHGHDQGTYVMPSLEISEAEIQLQVRKAVKEEMCLTVEDYLSRRTRHLLLDARAAMKAAPLIAKLMSAELKKDEGWERQQLSEFNIIAKNYLPPIN